MVLDDMSSIHILAMFIILGIDVEVDSDWQDPCSGLATFYNWQGTTDSVICM